MNLSKMKLYLSFKFLHNKHKKKTEYWKFMDTAQGQSDIYAKSFCSAIFFFLLSNLILYLVS